MKALNIVFLLLLPYWLFAQENCVDKLTKLHQEFISTFDNDRSSGKMILDDLQKSCNSCINRVATSEKYKIKIINYQSLSDYYALIQNFDSAIAYGKKVIKTAEKFEDYEYLANAQRKYGLIMLEIYQNDSAVFYFNSALDNYKLLNDPSGISKCYSNLGSIYLRQSKTESFLETYKKSLHYLDTIQHPKDYAILLDLKGHYYLRKGDFDVALGIFIKTLKIYERINSKKGELITLMNIGIIYAETKLFNDALTYFKKGLTTAKKMNDEYLISSFETNVGMTYLDINKIDSAKQHLTNAIQIFSSNNNFAGLAAGYEGLGKVAILEEQYNLGIEYLKKAILFGKESENTNYLAAVYLALGEAYKKINKYDLSIINFKESIRLSSINGNKKILKQNHLNLSDIHEKKQDYAKAFYHKKIGETIADSIESVEMKNIIRELKIKFEADLKEKENEKLALQLKSDKQKTNFLIVLSCILGLSLLSVIINFMLKNKVQKLEKEKQISKINNLKSTILENNKLINDLKEQQKIDPTFSQNITEKLLEEKNWPQFMIEFEVLYKGFFSELKAENSSLTKNDLRFLALVKLKLSDKEIAELLNIAYGSVRKIKYRLKKKLSPTSSVFKLLD